MMGQGLPMANQLDTVDLSQLSVTVNISQQIDIGPTPAMATGNRWIVDLKTIHLVSAVTVVWNNTQGG